MPGTVTRVASLWFWPRRAIHYRHPTPHTRHPQGFTFYALRITVLTMNAFDLTGRTALVTGCRRGIGKAMAIGLAEAGADIIGASANLEDSGSDIEQAVTAVGRNFTPYQADFSDRESVHAFTRQVNASHPTIDILVGNAGSILRAPAEDHSDDYWDTILETNLNSNFILAREFAPGMLERGHGKIIFTASVLSFQGGITVPGYAASKGGLAQLTKALANEWASKGINVNAIAPGYIATDNNRALQDDPVRCEQILTRIPAGRWGTPDDFKGPVVFLASDESSYMNGEIMVVDGGWMGR